MAEDRCADHVIEGCLRQLIKAPDHASTYVGSGLPIFRFRQIPVKNRRSNLVFIAEHGGQLARPDAAARPDLQYRFTRKNVKTMADGNCAPS